MANKNKIFSTNKLTKTAVLAAAAFILQLIGSMLGLRVGGFLDVEISDYPAIIGAFALGPVCGTAVELIKNLIHCMITRTGFVGEFANFVVNGIFVFVIGMVYKYNRTKKGAVISLILGGIALTVAAVFVNLYIMLPLYMSDADFSARLKIVLTLITPFNALRALVLSVITMLSYKKIRPLLK